MKALLGLVIFALLIVGFWKLFEKAGKPGWASIIPFYNIYVLLQIAGKPAWWLVLYVIPIINIIAGIVVTIELAKKFGKSGGFVAGMIFLPFIFYPVLGFGDAVYQE